MNIALIRIVSPLYRDTLRTVRAMQHEHNPLSFPDIAIPYTDAEWSSARGVNMMLEYAAVQGFRWMIMGTADLYIHKPPTILPSSDLSSLLCYDTNETIPPNEVVAQNTKNPSSFMLFGPKIIYNRALRQHEGFKGHYWTDFDFQYNVLQPAGILPELCDAEVIHYNLQRTADTKKNTRHNFKLYDKRYRELHGDEPPLPS